MSAPAEEARFLAPAKINLYLHVGAVRSDGYHDVTTVLQTIDLADEVVVRPSERFAVSCEPDIGVPEAENLAYRAAESLARAVGREPSVEIRVRKRIPTGAGLGGGSSDAAAAITALAALWRIEDPGLLATVAGSLGADVPFFLSGGTSVFGERGDVELRRLPGLDLDLVVVHPCVGVSTAEAYAAFDRHAPSGDVPVDATIAACVDGRPAAVAGALHNNMTRSSIALVPQVAEAVAFTQSREGVLGTAMCGSGSAVFGVCTDTRTADRVARQAAERGWFATASVTIDRGVCEAGREVRE